MEDRFFLVIFNPDFMGRRLQKYRDLVRNELVTWARTMLPTLSPRDDHFYSFDVPIRITKDVAPLIHLDVKVFNAANVIPPVRIGGWLPSGKRLHPVVEKALRDKLQKLVEADAECRFLMIDLSTISDSDVEVANIIIETAPRFPLLQKIDKVVFALTFGLTSDSDIFFRLWDPKKQTWSDRIQAHFG